MYRMEGDVVDSIDEGLVLGVSVSIATVALEREIVPAQSAEFMLVEQNLCTYVESLSSTYLMKKGEGRTCIEPC